MEWRACMAHDFGTPLQLESRVPKNWMSDVLREHLYAVAVCMSVFRAFKKSNLQSSEIEHDRIEFF